MTYNQSMIAEREKQARNRPGRQPNGRFAPGVSGNPNGRPKAGASLAELIRIELDRPMRGRRTRKEHLARVIVERALSGDHRFCRLVLERAEPTQPPGEEESISFEQFVRMLRISAGIPDQPAESRQRDQRLLKAIDTYEREVEAEEAALIDEDDSFGSGPHPHGVVPM